MSGPTDSRPKQAPPSSRRGPRALLRGASHPAETSRRTGPRPGASTYSRPWYSRVPGPAWACALVACLSAIAWSLITPPFQAPDEPAHFAYTEIVARADRLPSSNSGQYPRDELLTLAAIGQERISLHPEQRTIASRAEQSSLERFVSAASRSSGVGNAAGLATSQPPLYYALEGFPYSLGSDVLERLALMRLLSALLAGVTALFAYMFIRESLPGAPWAWTVGGLGVALFPLLGFTSGSVNPEGMLYAVCTALFFLLARAFRRGFTQRRAILIGLVTAVGFLTKLNFIGVVPGVVLALTVLFVRARRTPGSGAVRSVALALAIAMSPVCVYLFVNLLSHRAGLGLASAIFSSTVAHRSLSGEMSYVWQLYLPRLPGMHTDFPDLSTTRTIWFDGLVGQYGWIDTLFPGWVYDLVLIPAGSIAALALRELVSRRRALWNHFWEIASYLLIGLGVMIIVGASSYLSFPEEGSSFAEARYLLPMIALFGVILALAARGAGRRFGPSVGVLIVILFLGQDIVSQLQVVARFYG